jgi:hypothetical protein
VAVLLEWASDAVSGLPAYTTPAWPAELKGEPAAVADAPGVTGLLSPHVLAGAPGWPVVGLSMASADVAPTSMNAAKQAVPTMSSRTNFVITSS